MQVTERMYNRAMAFLAEHADECGADIRAMDAKLIDGGHLTNDEIITVCGLAQWWNMDKGN